MGRSRNRLFRCSTGGLNLAVKIAKSARINVTGQKLRSIMADNHTRLAMVNRKFNTLFFLFASRQTLCRSALDQTGRESAVSAAVCLSPLLYLPVDQEPEAELELDDDSLPMKVHIRRS